MSSFADKLRQLAKIEQEVEEELYLTSIEQSFQTLKKEFEERGANSAGSLLGYEMPEIESDGVLWMSIQTPKTGWGQTETQTPHTIIFLMCDSLARQLDLSFEGWTSSGNGWGILQWRKNK